MLKDRFTVAPAPHVEVAALVRAYHRAGAAANTSVYSLGLYSPEGRLEGGCLWMPPLPPAAKYAAEWGGCAPSEVLSLSRLVCTPDAPKNSASFLLGRALRLIREGGRFKVGLTYADLSWGQTGGIYRATNWTLEGSTRPRRLWVDPSTGARVSQKSKRNRTAGELRAAGYVQEKPSARLRFLILI